MDLAMIFGKAEIKHPHAVYIIKKYYNELKNKQEGDMTIPESIWVNSIEDSFIDGREIHDAKIHALINTAYDNLRSKPEWSDRDKELYLVIDEFKKLKNKEQELHEAYDKIDSVIRGMGRFNFTHELPVNEEDPLNILNYFAINLNLLNQELKAGVVPSHTLDTVLSELNIHSVITYNDGSIRYIDPELEKIIQSENAELLDEPINTLFENHDLVNRVLAQQGKVKSLPVKVLSRKNDQTSFDFHLDIIISNNRFGEIEGLVYLLNKPEKRKTTGQPGRINTEISEKKEILIEDAEFDRFLDEYSAVWEQLMEKLPKLSTLETQVLYHYNKNRDNKQVAEKLNITPAHAQQLFNKGKRKLFLSMGKFNTWVMSRTIKIIEEANNNGMERIKVDDADLSKRLKNLLFKNGLHDLNDIITRSSLSELKETKGMTQNMLDELLNFLEQHKCRYKLKP